MGFPFLPSFFIFCFYVKSVSNLLLVSKAGQIDQPTFKTVQFLILLVNPHEIWLFCVSGIHSIALFGALFAFCAMAYVLKLPALAGFRWLLCTFQLLHKNGANKARTEGGRFFFLADSFFIVVCWDCVCASLRIGR